MEGGGKLAGSTCGRPVNSGYQRREKKGERIGGGNGVCNEGLEESFAASSPLVPCLWVVDAKMLAGPT